MKIRGIGNLLKDANLQFFIGIIILCLCVLLLPLYKSSFTLERAFSLSLYILILGTIYGYLLVIPLLMLEALLLRFLYVSYLCKKKMFLLAILLISIILTIAEYYLLILFVNYFLLPPDKRYTVLLSINQVDYYYLNIFIAKVTSVTLIYSLRHYRGWFKYS